MIVRNDSIVNFMVNNEEYQEELKPEVLLLALIKNKLALELINWWSLLDTNDRVAMSEVIEKIWDKKLDISILHFDKLSKYDVKTIISIMSRIPQEDKQIVQFIIMKFMNEEFTIAQNEIEVFKKETIQTGLFKENFNAFKEELNSLMEKKYNLIEEYCSNFLKINQMYVMV
jgi:hypothetical protein